MHLYLLTMMAMVFLILMSQVLVQQLMEVLVCNLLFLVLDWRVTAAAPSPAAVHRG